MGITTPHHRRRTADDIKASIRANQNLLAFYDSPFPDAQEKAKRKELRDHIGLLQYELSSLEKH